MRIKTKMLATGMGIMLAGSLACAGVVTAFATESAAGDAAEVSTDTRLGNNIGFGENGGTTLDNYSEYADKLTYADKVAAKAEACLLYT